jgi:menaquinone-dependent protoporphyrinogen IX oxidase
MRALVVYESMYGNTHEIAGNIADGLRSNYEVTLVPVAEATTDLVAGADLLVGGAPTHVHGLPSVATQRVAGVGSVPRRAVVVHPPSDVRTWWPRPIRASM